MPDRPAQELEAIYGLHHETSREGSNSDEHHSLKTDDILRQVLAVLDKNGDGIVTKREFLSAGPGALPNFEGVEGLGHHYNSEGEVRAAHCGLLASHRADCWVGLGLSRLAANLM